MLTLTLIMVLKHLLIQEAGHSVLIKSKLQHLKDVRYKTFTTIFNSQIAAILYYSSSIWSHKKAPECDVIQNKAMQYF